MAPCEPCPAGRYTEYVPGDGSWQSSINSCKVLPGHGVYSGADDNPWAPTIQAASPDMVARPCPLGFASLGDKQEVLVTSNPMCKKCPGFLSTAAEGSSSCDGESPALLSGCYIAFLSYSTRTATTYPGSVPAGVWSLMPEPWIVVCMLSSSMWHSSITLGGVHIVTSACHHQGCLPLLSGLFSCCAC